MRFSNELKAGFVILLAVAVGFIFFVKTASLKTETYEIKTDFRYAGDLKIDAVVKLSGIEVGRVIQIKFVYDPETMVECVMQIDAKAKVRSDSIAYIATSGFVGDAYIGLTPGKSDEYVKVGTTIASEDPIQMRLLMKKADDIAKNLDKILVEVKSLVVDNKQGINNIVKNLESTTANFDEFSTDVKKHPWKLLFRGKEK